MKPLHFVASTAALFMIASLLNGCSKSGLVSLSIQGTKPVGYSSGRLDLLKEFWVMAARAETLTAVASPTAVTLSVTDAGSSTPLGSLSLTDARVVLKQIQLKAEEDQPDSNLLFHGPYVVNLLTNEISPSVEALQIAQGTYREIVLKLHKIEIEDRSTTTGEPLLVSSDPLFQNSIYLQGSYTPTGADTAVPFVFSYDLTEEFKLTGPGKTAEGFTVEDAASHSILIAFQMANWFNFANNATNSDHVDFAVLSNASSITLDKNSSGNLARLRQVIRDNIKASAEYGLDSDRDEAELH